MGSSTSRALRAFGATKNPGTPSASPAAWRFRPLPAAHGGALAAGSDTKVNRQACVRGPGCRAKPTYGAEGVSASWCGLSSTRSARHPHGRRRAALTELIGTPTIRPPHEPVPAVTEAVESLVAPRFHEGPGRHRQGAERRGLPAGRHRRSLTLPPRKLRELAEIAEVSCLHLEYSLAPTTRSCPPRPPRTWPGLRRCACAAASASASTEAHRQSAPQPPPARAGLPRTRPKAEHPRWLPGCWL